MTGGHEALFNFSGKEGVTYVHIAKAGRTEERGVGDPLAHVFACESGWWWVPQPHGNSLEAEAFLVQLQGFDVTLCRGKRGERKLEAYRH